MATRKSAATPASQPANLSLQQMKAAIPKLGRRLSDLKGADLTTIRERGAPEMTALQQKLDATLVDVFGHDSLEYRKYSVSSLDAGGIFIRLDGRPTPPHEVQEGYRTGISRAISTLETIVELFNEQLGDSGETTESRAFRTLESLDLHPEIADASVDLFKGGHYANAVEDACKVLDMLVQLRSKRNDISGTDLMQTVFSAKNPVLKFNALQTETEQSEQRGMMNLYAGVMLAFRNPRAHALVDDEATNALEIIGLINFLAKSLSRAKR